jgi:hypothetical protein
MTDYQNLDGKIWELCKDGEWRELFTDAAIRRLMRLELLAESNGKLAHDLGIKCEELRNQLNFLADHFPTEKQTKQP